MSSSEQTLGEILQLVTRDFGANWTKSGRLLRFADPEWFIKRAWAVPQVWIDYWVARGQMNSGLNLDDFTEIGNLRDEQIDHTIMLDSTLLGMGAGDAARNRYILRFYGTLTPEECQTLSTRSMSASELSDAQWAALRKALAAKNAACAALEKGSQAIHLSQSGSELDIIKYKFAFFPGASEPPVTFELTKGLSFSKIGSAKDKPAKPPGEPELIAKTRKGIPETTLPVCRESCSRYVVSFGNKIPETPKRWQI